MTPQSRRQVVRLLETFAAGGVGLFDLGALDHDTERMHPVDDWGVDGVLRSLGWLAARNASGRSIFVRPARSLDISRWILVDDLDRPAVERLWREARPSAVVETSPGNHQAWLCCDRGWPAEARLRLSRHLAQRFGGDPGAVGAGQFGRMPGTVNRKPARVGPDGRGHWATLKHAVLHPLPLVPPPADPASQPKSAGPRRAGSPGGPGGRSRSEMDYALACRILEAGKS